ncbi:hypothetical protein HT031_001235 [Scenedesmus sp. PABB004]|nr:hypothetical protein HT031_001235 [Scenedesmus sp. PABB004]
MDELRELLAQTPLSRIVGQQEIVLLEHNQSVADALKLLARHHILSAPLVVNPGLEDVEGMAPGESASPQLLGWLDVKDIIRAFLAYLHEHKAKLPSNMLALMTELEQQGPHFAAKTLITVLGSEDRGLVYQTDAEASVLTAIRDMFLGRQPGGRVVHRLAIFDDHGEITHIVSHVDVLRFLLKHKVHLGAAAGQTLRELGLVAPERGARVVVLEPHTPALLAYERLAAAGVTGAPVLSTDGELIANLSVSDIRCPRAASPRPGPRRPPADAAAVAVVAAAAAAAGRRRGIQPDHLGVLALPVAEFLAVKHGTSYLGYSQHGSSAAHPFFASRRHAAAGGMRAPGADAADADGARAAAAGGGGGDDVPLITCAADATLLEVLTTMCDNVVHRVYVREPGAKPHEVVGVVTPTDILTLLASLGEWGGGEAGEKMEG